jgi:hypothetical protein
VARDLLVAVWRVQWTEFSTLSLDMRRARFRAVVNSAWLFLDDAAEAMAAVNPLYLFVAPEYYWLRDQHFEPYTADEKDTIEREIAAVSGDSPGMVIIPGSINFKVDAGLLSPFLGGRTYAASSYVPVYCDGHRIHQYDKRFDDGNFTGHTADSRFVPGWKSGAFTHAGVKFGVDVCGDWGQGRLAGDVGSNLVDVHVVCSATHVNLFDHLEKLAVRDGGYFVHADADDHPGPDQQKNGVWAVARGKGLHYGDQGRSLRDTIKSRATPMNVMAQKALADTVSWQGGGNVTKLATLRGQPAARDLLCYSCPL